MATFGAVEHRGDPWCEGLSPYVSAKKVTIQQQTDMALYLLYWNYKIGDTLIPKDVRDEALIEWERRYPFMQVTTEESIWWHEWMNDTVSRRHGVFSNALA